MRDLGFVFQFVRIVRMTASAHNASWLVQIES
jgi:hypothetical protein